MLCCVVLVMCHGHGHDHGDGDGMQWRPVAAQRPGWLVGRAETNRRME